MQKRHKTVLATRLESAHCPVARVVRIKILLLLTVFIDHGNHRVFSTHTADQRYPRHMSAMGLTMWRFGRCSERMKREVVRGPLRQPPHPQAVRTVWFPTGTLG